MTSLKARIREAALGLGFSACGFAENTPLEEIRPRYEAWLRDNGGAGLTYLSRYLEQRLQPEKLVPGTRTVIALLLNYFPPEPLPADDRFIFAKYVCTPDYHRVVKEKMQVLSGFLANECGAKITRAFVDSGPVQEKEWAVRCGVGWQGKNTLVINRKGGSFFFIGILFTDLTVEPDPSATGLCGSCDRCVKACPTGALDTPYHLNVTRCISFHTIENHKEIPPEIGSKLNRRIYGCDICQDACPYNRAARPNSVPEFTIPEQLRAMRTKDWLSLNEEDFNRIFEDTPVKRIGYAKLMANIRAASPSGTFPG